MSVFKRTDFSVKRRFSDFLGLHSKLASKYLHVGYIVPPAPEKSIVGKQKSQFLLPSSELQTCSDEAKRSVASLGRKEAPQFHSVSWETDL